MQYLNRDLFRALCLIIFPLTLPFNILIYIWNDIKCLVNILFYAQDGAVMSLEEEIKKKEEILRVYKR